jgi:hypothetical protein
MVGARRSKGAWLAAVAVTAGVHAIVIGLLVPNAGPVGGAEPPVVEVELLPPLKAEPIVQERSPRASPRNAVAEGSPSQAPAAAPRETEAAVADSPAPALEPLQDGEVVGALRQGLRQSAGCEPNRFASPTERRDCERRQMALARLRPPGPQAQDDLSKGGRFAPRDPVPWLARPPTKGCKPKTGGGSGMGDRDVPVIGIACVFRF